MDPRSEADLSRAGTIIRLGIAFVLVAPLVSMTPLFTPPASGCPPCPNFPDVRTPFVNIGILVGLLGALMCAYGGLDYRRSRSLAQSATRKLDSDIVGAALLGFVVLAIALILMGTDLTGPGWSVLLYQGEGMYLGAIGIGMLFFALFAVLTREKLGAIALAAGILLCGTALLFTYGLSSDFATRCFADVGCDPGLANSTVSEMIHLGYLLALGAFVLGLGLAAALWRRKSTDLPASA
jgi:hypothetical protein